MQSYTRHKLKQDRFAETAHEAADWAGAHRSTTFLVGGIIVVVAVIAAGLYLWHDHQTEQGNLALGKAMRTAAAQVRQPGEPAPQDGSQSFSSLAEREKAAEKEFSEAADKYSWTQAGKIARYMAGATAAQAGDNAVAERELKSAAGSGDRDLAALARLALANFYRSLDRQSDAAKLYDELAGHPAGTVSKAQAQLEKAEMYEKSNPQEAANLYQQVQKENPATMAGQIAAAKLQAK
ncbi:MAG TPA: tetratricopeptide repeat protein [Candidatus Angelobacter sp.]|nr:tetratricopeptide repeat protein [Candidatus Angelobacter sp.]